MITVIMTDPTVILRGVLLIILTVLTAFGGVGGTILSGEVAPGITDGTTVLIQAGVGDMVITHTVMVTTLTPGITDTDITLMVTDTVDMAVTTVA